MKEVWEKCKKIEDNEKCPNCNKKRLVDTGKDYEMIFLCANCGYICEYDFKNDKWKEETE